MLKILGVIALVMVAGIIFDPSAITFLILAKVAFYAALAAVVIKFLIEWNKQGRRP
jgi:hypothetical protein